MLVAFRIEQVGVLSAGWSFVYCVDLECELPITLPIHWLGEIAATHFLTTTVVNTQLLGQLRPEFGFGKDSVLTAIGLRCTVAWNLQGSGLGTWASGVCLLDRPVLIVLLVDIGGTMVSDAGVDVTAGGIVGCTHNHKGQ